MLGEGDEQPVVVAVGVGGLGGLRDEGAGDRAADVHGRRDEAARAQHLGVARSPPALGGHRGPRDVQGGVALGRARAARRRRGDRPQGLEVVAQEQPRRPCPEQAGGPGGDGVQDLGERCTVGDRALQGEQRLEEQLALLQRGHRAQALLGELLLRHPQVALRGEDPQRPQAEAEDPAHAGQQVALFGTEGVRRPPDEEPVGVAEDLGHREVAGADARQHRLGGAERRSEELGSGDGARPEADRRGDGAVDDDRAELGADRLRCQLRRPEQGAVLVLVLADRGEELDELVDRPAPEHVSPMPSRRTSRCARRCCRGCARSRRR